MAEIQLIIGDSEGSSVVFGPLSAKGADRSPTGSFDFIDGPITIRGASGQWHLSHRSGIEPLALAQFRDDLGALRAAGKGLVFFGDHDFGQIVELKVTDRGCIHVTANNAADNVFDIEIGEFGWQQVEALMMRIDEIEQRLGSLTGTAKVAESHRRPTTSSSGSPDAPMAPTSA